MAVASELKLNQSPKDRIIPVLFKRADYKTVKCTGTNGFLSECCSLLPLSSEPSKNGHIWTFSNAAANSHTPEAPSGRENYAALGPRPPLSESQPLLGCSLTAETNLVYHALS